MINSQIEEIKQNLNIVDIVSEYISLKKTGVNHKGCCPFHNEKTPSFVVSEEKQIWHCFGCGEGGDMFEFVKKIEGIEFYEALKIMASRANVKLKQDPNFKEKSTSKGKSLDVLQITSDFFHALLLKHPKAKQAKEYLDKRGVNENSIKIFNIGYSPAGWDILKTYLNQKSYTDQELFLSGITVEKTQKNGFYDRFRNRLMFPITNPQGDVIGFSARVLDEDNDKMGKYINSPQSVLYNKSYVLYGLSQAKHAIKQLDSVILVEGQLDVISSYQAGVKNVVASSGTALTSQQIQLLKRYTNNILMCFDTDKAGEIASEKGIKVALSYGMNVKYVILPNGKDPDECIKEDPSIWQIAINKALPVIDYYLENKITENVLKDNLKRSDIINKILALIFLLESSVEQNYYIRKLSSKIDVPENILFEELAKFKNNKNINNSTEQQNRTGTKYSMIQSKNNHNLIEKQFLSIIFNEEKVLVDYSNFEDISVFLSDFDKKLYGKVLIHYNKASKLSDLLDNDNEILTPDELKFIRNLSLLFDNSYTTFQVDDLKIEANNLFKNIKKDVFNKYLKELERKVVIAEKEGDKKGLQEISNKFNKIKEKLTHI